MVLLWFKFWCLQCYVSIWVFIRDLPLTSIFSSKCCMRVFRVIGKKHNRIVCEKVGTIWEHYTNMQLPSSILIVASYQRQPSAAAFRLYCKTKKKQCVQQTWHRCVACSRHQWAKLGSALLACSASILQFLHPANPKWPGQKNKLVPQYHLEVTCRRTKRNAAHFI